MLNPFKDCPYLILGLPPDVNDQAVKDKWKQLCREIHPDKNIGGEEAAKLRMQLVNDARDQALARKGSADSRFGTADRDEIMREAEQRRKLYETLWIEQTLTGYRKKENDRLEAERVKQIERDNNTREETRIRTMRADNDAAEAARVKRQREANDAMLEKELKKARIERNRKPTNVWKSDRFVQMTKDVDDFVTSRIKPSADSFVSCKELFARFSALHPEADRNFVYRCLASTIEHHHPGAKASITTRKGERSYKGFCVDNE
jgi:hypothetical protein